eukprot:UN25304
MLGYDNAFNDDFRIFEKIDFLKFKNWLKNIKLKILRRIRVRIKGLFCSKKFYYSPQTHLESTSPSLLPTCIPDFDFFLEIASKIKFNF